MSELRLSRPAISGGGGAAAKVVSTATGALLAGVAKTVLFSGGATFPNDNYSLQVQDSGQVVLVDTLVKGDGVVDATNVTSFTITVLVDLPLGLTVVAIGS
jgi:hypothetical protein